MGRQLSITEGYGLYIRDFIAFKGQSAKTQEAYTYAGRELVRRFGEIDICSLTFDDVRDWKLWLDKGRSPNTVRNYIVCLRVVLKFLRQRGYEVMNPDDIPVPKREIKQVEYLTEIEMENLFNEVKRKTRGYSNLARTRNLAIMKTLYATGLRNSELCSLDRNTIKENTFTVIGKGNKPRICFIDDESLDCVKDYLSLRDDKNPALFLTLGGKRMKPGDVRRMFEIIRNRSSDFDFIHPHTIRHSYATKMLNRRVDIRYIKEFMGHANLDTTNLYTHVTNPDLKEIYLNAHKLA